MRCSDCSDRWGWDPLPQAEDAPAGSTAFKLLIAKTGHFNPP
jgi:hypothetical protein